MGLTTAMYTGLTGIAAHQAKIESIGNNIANVNTVGFKNSRTLFQTQFARTLTMGAAPNENTGGTNPLQFGLGVAVGATQRDFSAGSVETTGISSDLAIEGDGFFIVDRGGQRLYTRDGSFTLNQNNQLVTADGNLVQGFGVDGNFTLTANVLQALQIPLGSISVARPTTTALLDGDLSATSTIAVSGSEHRSQAMVSGGGAPADAGTLLSDLRSAGNPTVPLFQDGTAITVNGATKGARQLPPQTFVVGTTGATVGDFASWLQGTLGIQTGADLPGRPGVVIENGSLVIRGNAGEHNELGFDDNTFVTDFADIPLPLQLTQSAEANGTGVYTAFTVYDSLGNPLTVNATFALEETPNLGPVWRYYLESPDSLGGGRALGTGTIQFDTAGGFVSATQTDFAIDRSGTGAAAPLTFSVDFSGIHALSSGEPAVILDEQDGVPPGTLSNYSIGSDGVITGVFTNGDTRTLGQVALAVFPNRDGLVSEADNNYSVGPNSGEPKITFPGAFGAGKILGGALELSNVDLSREFIGLITSSTGFQASSRVISVSSDLLDQLLLVLR